MYDTILVTLDGTARLTGRLSNTLNSLRSSAHSRLVLLHVGRWMGS